MSPHPPRDPSPPPTAADDAVRDAVARLAAWDGRLGIVAGSDAAPGADGWIRASALEDPSAWPAIARAYAAGVGSERLALGGSCALQGHAWYLAGLALGVWGLTGIVPDLSPGRIRVRLRDGRTLGVAAPAARARAGAPRDDPAALADELVSGHVAPIAVAVRAATRISARVAWGGVAASCAGVAGLIDLALPADRRPAWRDEVGRLLAAPAWPAHGLVDLALVAGPSGAVLAHERRTCCLMRLAPGATACASCERLDPLERRTRMLEAAAGTPAPSALDLRPAR
jgi:hypothetical protein